MCGFLMSLRVRGETADEITGGAMTLRAKVLGVKAPADAIDIVGTGGDVKGTWNVRSEEHTSELQSLMRISYAVFCLKKKINHITIGQQLHTNSVQQADN